MFPEIKILGLYLYDIFFILGIIAALSIRRLLSDKSGFSARLFNFCLFDGIFSIACGYGSAVLFQAFYNFLDDGKFEFVATTGATFYGGLIGGVVLFLTIYFVVGHFWFRDGEHKRSVYKLIGIAACSIPAAHSLGRLGCLMAGCCHGRATDSFFGIFLAYPGYKVIPTQLYEAIFLAALCAVLIARYLKNKSYNMPIYMASYGVWRFLVEYLRGDHRGETIVSFLTPSQLIAVILIIGSAVVFVLEKNSCKKEEKSYEE